MYIPCGKKLKKVFIFLTTYTPRYLDELVRDLEDNGIGVVYVDCDSPVITDDNEAEVCFCVTDDPAGRFFSEKSGIGYSAFIPEGGPAFPCENAECVIEGFDEVTADFIVKLYQRHNGIPWTVLETERTVIREMTLDDINELYELYDDPEIKRFVPPLYESREEEIEFEEAYIEKMYGVCGFGYWLVISKDKGEVIGRAGISPRNGYDVMEIGYLFDKAHRGQGIAFEVCSAVIEYARDVLGQEKLNAFIQKENADSIRLIERLGFHRIGEAFEDGNLMQIYRKEEL